MVSAALHPAAVTGTTAVIVLVRVGVGLGGWLAWLCEPCDWGWIGSEEDWLMERVSSNLQNT